MSDRYPLNYGRKGPPHRRWLRAISILVCIAAAVYACNYINREWFIAWRVAAPFWAARCARYTSPPNQVVYEEHNDKQLAWSPGAFTALSLFDRTNTRRYAAAPRCIRFFGEQADGIAEAPIFLGRLKVPNGGTQVVYVNLQASRPLPEVPPANQMSAAWVSQISHWYSHGHATGGGGWTGSSPGAVEVFQLFDDPQIADRFFSGKARLYRFYAGQRGADPSEVLIDVDADEQRLRIHGKLLSTYTMEYWVEWRASK